MSEENHATVKIEHPYDPRTPGCPRSGSLGALLRAGSRFSCAIESRLRSEGYPALRWLDVLVELHGADRHRLTQREIEARTAIAQHNLSRQLDRMEAEGLVRRLACPSDGRARHVVLTHDGIALRIAMGKAFTAAVASIVGSRLSLEDAGRLKNLLAALSAGGHRPVG